MKYITAQEAAALDQDLMSSKIGWSLDQLMELAGLSVACALQRLTNGVPCSVLVIAGPGNNGGDGLVAARHLRLFGYTPTVHLPKQREGIYTRLVKQLVALDVKVENAAEYNFDTSYDYIIDAVFGFSFSGEVRAPFDRIIERLARTHIPVLSVDVPSSWHIDNGQPAMGSVGHDFYPTALISLSAAKPCSKNFQGRHFLGGRFLGEAFRLKYGLPSYPGTDQVVELP